MIEVPADQAGLTVQCPQCGRLNDVPNVGDLPNLDKDGNYKVQDIHLRPEPERLAELHRTFSRDRVDEFGVEIDLRGPVGGHEIPQADLHAVTPPPPGTEIPLAAETAPEPPPALRYDPETGELIVELGVEPPTPVPPPKPLPTARALSYAGQFAADSPRGLQVLPALFRPINLLVMGLYAITLSGMFTTLWLSGYVCFFFIPGFFLFIMAVSHIANIIEETGPLEKDELPRLLRDVNLGEDYWYPFFRMLFSLLIAYAPFIAWNVWANLSSVAVTPSPLPASLAAIERPIYWTLFSIGTFFFPAVVLTLCTSGGLANLRPDRIIGVVAKAGIVDYGVAVLFWASVAVLPDIVARTAGGLSQLAIILISLFVMPILYSIPAHAFGWLLGSIYRQHHEQFPWAYQRHEPRKHLGFAVLRVAAHAPPPAQAPKRQPKVR